MPLFSLRALLLLLVIANVGFYAHTQGWLERFLGLEQSQREPARLNKQINADQIGVSAVLTQGEQNTQPTKKEPAPTSNLQSCAQKVEHWVIYMGPYKGDALQKKKAELELLGVTFTEISRATQGQSTQGQSTKGFSLGDFETESAAKAAQLNLSKKGVKTANVVLWGQRCPA